ncbi:uncharacterized protein LOC123675338 [Harmonia axyridis]|uniref:uncharacterized protein LOC123675338 n=1 Tax=Harmonia axyridis TaxID=115357 RepID=UPI001E276440|nr:uncharacterized protein LOC123675338 [Harmonia axyridis]
MKLLANNYWGADENTLLTIYRTLIRSKLDYGSIVYSTASKTLLAKLDVIQNTAIRLATGAYITSPSESLCREAGELPLKFRRLMLQSTYAARISADTNNPTRHQLYRPRYSETYTNQPNLRQPLYHLLNHNLLETNFPKSLPYRNTRSPPWTMNSPVIDTSLKAFNKDETHCDIIRNHFKDRISHYKKEEIIFTDASKSARGTGCAFLTASSEKRFKLPKDCSIFTAELFAIKKALECIAELGTSHPIIITDSHSSLHAIQRTYKDNTIVNDITDLICSIQDNNKSLTLMWIPSHCGIDGNEMVDAAAKEAIIDGHYTEVLTNYDLSNLCKNKVKDKWKSVWQSKSSKLALIDPTIHTKPPITQLRQDLVVLRRLRIGHTRETHQYLLRQESPPWCQSCNSQLTTRHMIIECQLFDAHRKLHNVSTKVEEALNINSPACLNTISFIKDTKFII